MKIVVTGAGGRLGRHVVRELAGAGHEVTGIDKVASGESPVRMLTLDLLDAPRIMSALVGAEAVVHLGNHIDPTAAVPDPAYNQNVVMNFNVFEAARVAGVRRLVFASSVQAMTGDRRRSDPPAPSRLPWLPLDGDHPAIPTNPYALSKAAGEDMLRYYARKGAVSAVAIRFPKLTVEPPPPEGWQWDEARLDEAFTWLTFADGARLVVAALAAAPAGFRVYFPAAPRPWMTGEVEALRQLYFPEVPVKGGGALRSFVDGSATSRETGWAPRDL